MKGATEMFSTASSCVFTLFFIISSEKIKSTDAIGELLPFGMYKIQNMEDKTVLTATTRFGIVPGRLHRLSEVITSDWRGLPEQEWKVDDSTLGIPEQYTLTPRRFERNQVSMWAPEKFYEVPNEWHLIYLGGDMWQVKNKDTNKCLINWGRGRMVDEWHCDKYAKNQQWIMIKL